MNFMEKFNEIADRTLVPIANKLGNQRHLAAIRDGMVVAIPLSILGGICLIISTPPFTPDTLGNWGFFSDILLGWYNWAQTYKAVLQVPYNMTMAMMGLFVAFAIAHNLAKHYNIDPLNVAIASTAVFLMVSAPTTSAVDVSAIAEGMSAGDITALAASFVPVTYLDAKGIFTAIIVSIGCVEIYRFMMQKNIRIKLPDGVPPAIASSFDAILPLFVCVIIFYALSLLVQHLSGQLFPAMLMSILAPAVSGLDSLVGICLITIIAQVFWCFGLHGASITQPIRLPFMQMYLIENIDATVIAQQPKLLPYIDRMVENIADALKLETDQVNVKATTEEGLGFTGNGEGISAHAVCCITKALDYLPDDRTAAGCPGCTGCAGM